MIIRVLYFVKHFKHFVFNQNNKSQKLTLRQATAYYHILEKYCIVEIIL